MNSTCQIHKGFDSFYIVLPRTLDHSALCDHCKHSRVAHIDHNTHCEHSTNYRLCCTCDTARLMLNTTSPLQDFHLKISHSSLMPPQYMTSNLNSSVHCQRLINHLQLGVDNMCPCCKCVSHNLMCHVNKESDKCLKCMHSTHHNCDLMISEAEWVCVNHEATYLWIKL